MAFNYTYRADDILGWDVDTRDLVENRDRELELYSTTIDDSFLNLNASNLTSGTVPSARMTGAYTGITGLGTLTGLAVSGTATVTASSGTAMSITNTGSGNSFLVEDASSTDSSPFVIDSTGNVGVGITVPGAKLDVQESGIAVAMRITNNGIGNSFVVEDSSTTDTSPFVISANGDVGIGLTLPSVKLDILGNQIIRAGTAQDGIQLQGRAGGTSNLSVTLTPTTLNANRTLTLPNVDGTAITTGNLSSITAVGTLASGSIPASLLTGTTLPATIVTSSLTSVGTITSGTWSGSFGAVSGANLTSLNATNLASGNVPGGRVAGSYTGITGVGTLAQELNVSGAACGYYFADRGGTGERFAWYSTSADAYLYSSRLGQNILGFARTTGQMYVYKGVNGSPIYGSYGTFNIYGQSGGWYGIIFPDEATTWMSAANGQYFGCYRNNTTWNFYVQNGTFVPSDERYKRDIEPLEHGLDFIREIIPVTFDPLTESKDDDPETTVGRTHYGFTTQNILHALSNAGETRDVAIVDIGGPANESNESDRQYLNHSGLIAPMVKAIQELDARLQQLETV